MIKKLPWITGLAAALWWLRYMAHPDDFLRLAAALGLTLVWFLVMVGVGHREIKRMTRKDSDDSR
jgi:hypothetical protein